MTTQLQDPFSPMDNGDFIAQMAQFSTVTGITEINNNLSNIGSKLEPNRVAIAAQFLGHSVLVLAKELVLMIMVKFMVWSIYLLVQLMLG